MTLIAVSGECLKAPFLPAVTPRAVSGENNAALFLRVRILVMASLCITVPSVALWIPLDLCGSFSPRVLRALVLCVAPWLLLVREVRLQVLLWLLVPPRAQRRCFAAVCVRIFAICAVNEVLRRGSWAVSRSLCFFWPWSWFWWC